ncbi:MAG: hypothetical protein CYPHOPRED_000358 [Cyphobasidiales sp. Tagirdzhanova-0007]|nr:MAG: hypothetical protein CYPHOPRED_000358 [Cyphobasidiales sp. Tagirdzhanova-0007]
MVVGVSIPLGSDGANLQFVGRAHVRGRKKWMKHILVTVDLLGLQFVWSTEMAYASPYLLSLGLSKAGMSAVFLAGPLSGLIVQPIIGTIADRSKSRFGRRRPIIVVGCLICVLSLLVFGYTRELASIFTSWGSNAHTTLTIWLAVLSVYALDFAINGVMAADRALIVDVLPVSQQEEANAWAARLAGAGSILGFWVGNVDLTSSFGFLGSTQIKILSLFAIIAMMATHAVTIFAVEERVLLDDGDVGTATGRRNIVVESLKDIWRTFRTLPLPIWDICKIQAFAWGGWFPILFFSTTYIAEIYETRQPTPTDPSTSASYTNAALPHEADPGTRAGSRAMFLQSLFSFVMSVLLPFFVNSLVPSNSSAARQARLPDDRGAYALNWTDSAVARLSGLLPTLPIPWLDLNLLWAISHVVFAVLMFATWLVGAVWSATLILTLVGFSWAVTGWAPTALLAQEILQDRSAGLAKPVHLNGSGPYADGEIAAEPESIGLMQRKQPSSIALSRDGVDDEKEYISRSPSPKSGTATPRRTYQPTVTEDGAPIHPEPLDVSTKLRALVSSPEALDLVPSTLAPQLKAATSRTLQVRHTDSFSDADLHSLSSDEEASDLPEVAPLALPSASQKMQLQLRDNSSNDTIRTRPEEDIDLNQEEQDFALEAQLFGGEGNAETGRTADQAGAILGIANVFVVLPQFLTSFISSIVFAFLAPAHDSVDVAETVVTTVEIEATRLSRRAGIHIPPSSNDAIGVIFRVGGFSALVAAWLTWQMRKRKRAALALGSM